MTANQQIARVILQETKSRKNLFADSLFVVDSLIHAIKKYKLREAIEYLNGASMPTNHISGSTNFDVKPEHLANTEVAGEYGII